MSENTLYRATAVGANMTGSGSIVMEQTRTDPKEAAEAAMEHAQRKPGIDMSTVYVDEIERFDINPMLDVDESDVPNHEIVSKAMVFGWLDEVAKLDVEEVMS